MTHIQENAEIADRAFKKFQEMQTELGMDAKDFSAAKQELSSRLKALEDELDRYLAFEYGINRNKIRDVNEYEKRLIHWRESHQPFHWFIEFYGIMKDGGFDVIIGNPPYVLYRKVKKYYSIQGYKTGNCNNLYAFTVERSFKLSKEKRIGWIIPSAAFGTPATSTLRKIIRDSLTNVYISYFSGDAHPSTLFEGVKLRLSILLTSPKNQKPTSNIYTTGYLRWYAEERAYLFRKINYEEVNEALILDTFPKIKTDIEKQIINRLNLKNNVIGHFISKTKGNYYLFYHNAPVFFIRSMDFAPYYESETSSEPSSNHFKRLYVKGKNLATGLIAILNSSTFYFWFTNYSANRDLTLLDINNFPLFLNEEDPKNKLLGNYVNELMKDLKKNSMIREYKYSTGKVRYQEFYMRKSKSIIDEIDRILAENYGLTEEELDFIINYDIKYRMGLI